MLKLIKWDFINYIKVRHKLLIGFAVIIMITAIVPAKTNFISTVINTLGMITSTAFFLYSWFSAVKELTAWLGRDSVYLELTQGSNPCLQLLSKLFRSMLIAGMGTLLTAYIMKYIVKYNGFIQITGFYIEKVFEVFLGMLTLFILIIFAYLFSNIFSFLRKRLGVVSIMITAILVLLLGLITIYFFWSIGAWDVSNIKDGTGLILASNNTHRSIETVCYYSITVIISVFGFLGSCILLERKFEFYQSKGA